MTELKYLFQKQNKTVDENERFKILLISEHTYSYYQFSKDFEIMRKIWNTRNKLLFNYFNKKNKNFSGVLVCFKCKKVFNFNFLLNLLHNEINNLQKLIGLDEFYEKYRAIEFDIKEISQILHFNILFEKNIENVNNLLFEINHNNCA